MAFHQGKIELRRADRRQPDFAMVSQAELAYTIGNKIPLYHPEGIGVGLRCWGEPPLRSAFAIIQQTKQGWKPRTLLPEECWRLQGLDIDQLHKLKQLGTTQEQIASAAGNAITGLSNGNSSDSSTGTSLRATCLTTAGA